MNAKYCQHQRTNRSDVGVPKDSESVTSISDGIATSSDLRYCGLPQFSNGDDVDDEDERANDGRLEDEPLEASQIFPEIKARHLQWSIEFSFS